MKQQITIEASVNAPIEKVWKYWVDPMHIVQWSFASDDWHAPRAENDLRVGGKFVTRMEAKDGSSGFDFGGTYTVVEENKRIEYTMGDDEDARKVKIEFSQQPEGCKVVVVFDAEEVNSIEMQRNGWQSILNNFKKHVEAA